MRLHVLDGLRFVAAFAVVLFHFTARDHSRWAEGLPVEVFPVLSELTRYGYVGVHLFFVISGFVILMSAWGRSIPDFIGSRAGRLFPVFWTAVLMTAALRLWWPTFTPRSASDVVVNLTMLSEPLGVPAVDGVYWTLWVELQFYVLVGLLLAAGITERRLVVGSTLASTGFTVAYLVDPSLGATFTIVGWMPLFAAGMMLFLLHRFGFSRARVGALTLNVVLAAWLAGAHQTGSVDAIVSGGGVNAWAMAGLVVVAIGLVGLAVLVRPVQRVNWGFLGTLGALTYPLYLLHEYFGWAVIEVLDVRAGRWVALAGALLVSVVISVVVLHLVDRRWGRPLRRTVTGHLEAPPWLPSRAPREMAGDVVAGVRF